MTSPPTAGDRIVDGNYRALPTELEQSLLTLVLNLAAEVWTLRDRTRLLQEILADRNVLPYDMFDHWRDQPDHVTMMAGDRDAFIARMFRSVTAVSADDLDPKLPR